MTSKHTPEPGRLINLLVAGLITLQATQERNEMEAGVMRLFPPPSNTEINALVRAFNDGRIRIVAGVCNVVTFKRTAREAS